MRQTAVMVNMAKVIVAVRAVHGAFRRGAGLHEGDRGECRE